MSERKGFQGMQVGVQLGSSDEPVDGDTPFRIVVIGDFCGRSNQGRIRSRAELVAARPRLVDCDNFDQVLSDLKVELPRTISDSHGQPVSVSISELDDFEPDRLYHALPLFAHLRQLRSRLLKSATFAEAADEVRGWAVIEEPTPPAAPEPAAPAAAPAADDVSLEDILGKTMDDLQRDHEQRPSIPEWQRLVAEVVAPYATPGADPQQGQLVSCVDTAVTKTMSALLHHADFQSLEAAWRGIDFLIRRLETGTSLKVYLLDWSRQELAADLLDCDDLRRSALYKVLVEQTVETPGADPWSLLVGNFAFGGREVEALELAQMAQIAAAAGAPFVAAGKGDLVGCVTAEPTSDPDDWQPLHRSEAWDALRQFEPASSVALLWPRFLLRLPYGKQTIPVDAFDYDETQDDWSHGGYLWGNPALAVACMLGQAYSRSQWDMHPRDVPEIGDLPLHVHESEARPCSELLFSDRGLERVLSAGLTPLVAFRGQDAIRLGGLQAITGQPLRGRWG